MSIRKRLWVCILLMSMVVVLLHVFSDTSQEYFLANSDADTIYIWYTDDSLTDYLNSAAVAYMEQYGVRVVPSFHSGFEYIDEIYDASLGGDEYPDLYILGTDSIEKAGMAGVALPVIDSRNVLTLMNFPEIALNSIVYSDEKMGYPFYYETAFMLYNTTYLQQIADSRLRVELGADSTVSENVAVEEDNSGSGSEEVDEANESFNDEGQIAETVSQNDVPPEGYSEAEWQVLVDEKAQLLIPTSVEGIIDFANKYSAPQGVENIFIWDVSDIFYNYFFTGAYMNIGGEYGDDISVLEILNDDTVVCLQVYQELNQFFSIDAETSSYENVVDDFIAGKTLFTIATSDVLERLEMAKFEGTFTWDYSVAPLPGVDSEHVAKGLSTTSAVVVNAYTDNREVADDFARFITYDYIDSFYTRTGKLQAANGTDDYIEDANDLVRNMYKQSVQLPKVMNLSNFWIELERTYMLIWEGEDVSEKLSELQEEMQRQIQ